MVLMLVLSGVFCGTVGGLINDDGIYFFACIYLYSFVKMTIRQEAKFHDFPLTQVVKTLRTYKPVLQEYSN